MPARSRRCRKLVRPHVAIVTTIAPVHLEFFGSLAKIADAKAEIFLGLEPGGTARDQPRHLRSSRISQRRAKARASRASFRSARTKKADARLVKCALHPGLLDRAGGHPRHTT